MTDKIGTKELEEAIESLPTAKTFDNVDDLINDLNEPDIDSENENQGTKHDEQ